MSSNSSTSGGIGLGAVIAILLSWTVNHSVGWAILHSIAGWFYVIYALCAYSEKFF